MVDWLASGKGGPRGMTANVAGKEGGGVGAPTVNERPTVAERITVALVKKAGEDLQTLQDRTGLSKTDIVNRAITLYEFIDGQVQAGNELIVRDPKTGETQLIRFL
jgi:hypothetical protein